MGGGYGGVGMEVVWRGGYGGGYGGVGMEV